MDTQVASLFEDAVEVNEEKNRNVEDFVKDRHKRMLEKVVEGESDSEDPGDEPEQMERDVLGLDDSDEEDSSDDSADEEDPLNAENEDRVGWGDKKKSWYGADTHEYEIMDDDEREEALKEEEEEALRLQKKALSQMVPEDFEDDTEMEEAGSESGDDAQEKGTFKTDQTPDEETVQDVLNASAPEVSVLLSDLEESRKQMEIWESRVNWNQTARMVYHLHASLVTNIAYYFTLRTDPSADGIDIRMHPVLMRIVKIRSLLRKALQIPCEEPPQKENPSISLVPAGEEKEKIASIVKSSLKEVHNEDTEDKKEKRKKKDKKKRKQKGSRKNDANGMGQLDDENRIQSLLSGNQTENYDTDKADDRSKKRKKLNQIVGAMERERQDMEGKRGPSVDIDYVRDTEKRETFANIGGDDFSMPQEDDEEVMSKMLAGKQKKKEKEEKKASAAKPHVYRFKDDVDPESRRGASHQVVRNRGLTRYRPRGKKIPRTKNRLAYDKAVIRRKGAVRDYAGKPGASYSGEASGINISVRKGSRLSNV